MNQKKTIVKPAKTPKVPSAFALMMLVAGVGGCSGQTVLPDFADPFVVTAGDDGDFTRPHSASELRVIARHHRSRPATNDKLFTSRRVKRASPAKRATPAKPVRHAKATGPAKRAAAKLENTATRRKKPTKRPMKPAGPAHTKNHGVPQQAGPKSLPKMAAKWDGALRRVETARRLVGRTDLGAKPFVYRVLRGAGQSVAVEGRPYAGALHRKLKSAGKLKSLSSARPGDIAFFARTHDLNGNGRPDDGVTWAAIVEQVKDGRIVFIAHRAGKVRRMAASPAQATVVRADDLVMNTRLVRWPGAKRSLTAGECLESIARP